MSTEGTPHSRWTDNPFRQPGLTPEQLEWLDKRDEATRIFQETGDDTMVIEICLFNPRDDEPEDEAEEEDAGDSAPTQSPSA